MGEKMYVAELTLIIIGAVIMVGNIVGYILFIRKMRDVISSERKKDDFWLFLALVLLSFFLAGYLVVGFTAELTLTTSFILFFGSIFVSIVLALMMRLLETAKERSIEIAETLIGIVDARDPNLNGHSRHVKELVMLFYKYLPMHLKFAINPVSLEFAALMHDIGKLGVPEAILNKPAKLTEEEWQVMRRHPEIGVELIKPLQSFDSITDWILYHHERIDGKGYYGKSNEEVPLAAKMLAIVDTYSAITMRRSYKEPRTHNEAVSIIKDVAGKQLDKELVEIFLTIPEEELEKCMPEKVKY